MSDSRKRAEQQDLMKSDGFRILCGVSMLFLAIVLAVSAIRQLSRGLIFSGVVGLVGTGLFTLVSAILLVGLIKRFFLRKKK